MIYGEFDGAGRPYIEGFLVIPRLEIYGNIRFLLDTGSESTCIHPADSLKLDIPFDRLIAPTMSYGIGGSSPYNTELAVLSFVDDVAMQSYRIPLYVAQPTESNAVFPSLLGRDVLNRWRMEYDPAQSMLEFTVRSADRTVN